MSIWDKFRSISTFSMSSIGFYFYGVVFGPTITTSTFYLVCSLYYIDHYYFCAPFGHPFSAPTSANLFLLPKWREEESCSWELKSVWSWSMPPCQATSWKDSLSRLCDIELVCRDHHDSVSVTSMTLSTKGLPDTEKHAKKVDFGKSLHHI